MKALVHGTLIDGTGTDPVSDATVIVYDDGRIADLGVGIDPPRGSEVIDVSGRTIIPGLIDCHVQFFGQIGRSMQDVALIPLTMRVLEAAERARKTLDAGFTSVRDTGFTPRGFKMAVQHGLIASPRLNIAVTMMSQTGGDGDALLP